MRDHATCVTKGRIYALSAEDGAENIEESVGHLSFYRIFLSGQLTSTAQYSLHIVGYIDLPSCVLKRRQDKFISRYISTENGFCQLLCSKL